MVCPPDSPNSPNSKDGKSDGGDKTTVLQSEGTTLNRDLQKAKEQDACLIIIRGTPQGHRFFLTQDEMFVGRDPAVDVSLSDQSISRKHARIEKKAGKVILTDLGSSNGTFINDKKVTANTPMTLAKEDMVKLGNFILKFLPAGEFETLAWGEMDLGKNTDPMLRIFNKGYLLEALDSEFKRAKALHTDFSMIFFDLDHFKKVNDTHGHDAGDYVLKEFTQLVRSSYLRPKDVFARYGGEEFVILLAKTNAQQASDIAERIRAAVEAHAFVYEGKRLSVTTSLGVAELTAAIDSPQTLLKTTDKALYAAKTGGRNRVVVAT